MFLRQVKTNRLAKAFGPFGSLALPNSAMRAALPRPPTVNDVDLSRGKRGLIRC
jgi:hypothetical protein